MAMVIAADGAARKVKNLGWLLRHAGEVERVFLLFDEEGGAALTAFLVGGGRYQTRFACASIAVQWVHRPCLRGVPLEVRDTCGYWCSSVC